MKAKTRCCSALFLGFSPRCKRVRKTSGLPRTLDEAARLHMFIVRVTSQRKENGFNRRRFSWFYTGGTLAAEAAGLLAGYLGVAAGAGNITMMLDADGPPLQIIDSGDDLYRWATTSDD